VRLGFLFTGAEETGLHGAEAFAVSLSASAEAAPPLLLSVDMVGSGSELRLVRKDGTLFLSFV
jgi:Zn-dependent M28 family amino/carboxypeptidase